MKSDLKRANALYRSGKYAKAIRLLEPQVFRYRESFQYYYILGMSCLRMADTGGAKTYLDRALSLSPHNTDALLGLAAVHLKRYEVTDALKCYLDVTDTEPKNRFAKRGLNLLRRNAERERLEPLIDSANLNRILPRDRSHKGGFLVLALVVSIVAAGTAATAYLIRHRPEPRERAVAELTIEDLDQITGDAAEVRYPLSEREIERAFQRAKDYFGAFRDNLAIREINTLLGSNASPQVKEQARTILGFIRPPDFSTIRDSFAFEDVAADPIRHRGTFIVWRGRTSNLDVGNDVIEFDLLVGYDTGEVLDGVVPVTIDFGIELTNGRPVEVLAKIVPEGGRFHLKAISIHKIVERE